MFDDMTEDEALHLAFHRGQPGFQGTAPALQGAQLLDIAVAQHRARPWTVTLAAMKQGSNPPLGGLLASAPPDNQVGTELFPGPGFLPPERLAYLIDGVYVILEWGVGNMRERAFVSYPFGGCSFGLHGASVRVSLASGFANVGGGVQHTGVPVIGGFISPGVRSQSLLPPTLITTEQDVDDADPVTFWVPPRAVGYRLYTGNDVDAAAADVLFRVDQLVWTAGPAPQYLDGTNLTPYQGQSNELSVSGSQAWQRATRNAANWTHLMPRTVGVKVSTVAAGAGVAVGVEWILDLG